MYVINKCDIFYYLCYFNFVCIHSGYSAIISQGKLNSTGETCYYDGRSTENDFCITLGSQPLSREASMQSCSIKGGTLVQEDSEITLGFLQQLMTGTGWQRSWLGGKKQSQQWQWFGGELLEESTFMQWNKLPPSDDNKDCVKIVPYKQYAWEDASCGQTHGYICETSAASNLCEEASKIFYEVLVSATRCFMLSHSNVALNWFSAKKECERYGASLGHIDFQEIHDRLVSVQPGIQSNVNGYWIGATKARWMWDSNITSETIEQFHWEDSQPNRSGNCLVLERFSGKLYRWANWNCSDELNYMCQYNKILLSDEDITTSSTTGDTKKDPRFSSNLSSHSTVPLVTDTVTTEGNYISLQTTSITSTSETTTEPFPYVTDESTTAVVSLNDPTSSSTTWNSDTSSEYANTTVENNTRTTSVSVIVNNITASTKGFNDSEDATSSPLKQSTISTVTNFSTHSYSIPYQQEQCHYIDLCWIIENHPDTTRSNWSDVLTFIRKATESLQFSDTCFQVSVVTYEKTVTNVFHFKDSMDKSDLLRNIIQLPFSNTSEKVNISTALQSLYRDIFTYSNGVRRGSKKLAILVKSGKTLLTDIDLLAIDLASKLKANGVYISALSINSIVEKSEAENILNTVASHPAHIFQQHLQNYHDLQDETVLQKLLYLFEHVTSLLLPRTSTSEGGTLDGGEPTAMAIKEENSTVLTVLLAAIVSFAVLIVVIAVIIGVLLVKKRKQRKGIRSRVRMTTVSDNSLTTYEELTTQSSISGYSNASIKSTGSHGSSRQKIARMKRHDRSIIEDEEGGITTPWGSMRSSRRSQKRTPIRSSIDQLTGGSWPAE